MLYGNQEWYETQASVLKVKQGLQAACKKVYRPLVSLFERIMCVLVGLIGLGIQLGCNGAQAAHAGVSAAKCDDAQGHRHHIKAVQPCGFDDADEGCAR